MGFDAEGKRMVSLDTGSKKALSFSSPVDRSRKCKDVKITPTS